ncbi:MAG TPA: hypothetical protein DEB31_07775 [Clostridiales bacterium]|nr:hypothetical protein [Clostridiales bacterium]
MYDNAPKGEQEAYVHLFGIKYADSLNNRSIIEAIVKHAEIRDSYVREIQKAVKLAHYVTLKDRGV